MIIVVAIVAASLLISIFIYFFIALNHSRVKANKELYFLKSMAENEDEFNNLISRYGQYSTHYRRLERKYWNNKLYDFLRK